MTCCLLLIGHIESNYMIHLIDMIESQRILKVNSTNQKQKKFHPMKENELGMHCNVMYFLF